MTPAIEFLKKNNIPFQVHEYAHDVAANSYGLEAAQKLGIDPARVFKTLVVAGPDGLAVCMVPVAGQLDLKQAARALRVKKCQLAEARQVEASSGYVLGGVSPLGQKKRLPSLLDASALEFESIFVSAGKRGLEIELPADALCSLLECVIFDIAR